MKTIKLTVLVLVLVMALVMPAFAESDPDDVVDEPERPELQINTDLFVFSREIQEQLAKDEVKVIYTEAINEDTVKVGVYPDEAGAREAVLNLLIQNDIGNEENFEIVFSEKISVMPISTDDPSDPVPGPPGEDSDPNEPVSDEKSQSQIDGSDGEQSDSEEEDFVRPDDENAEVGIVSVEDSAEDGEDEGTDSKIEDGEAQYDGAENPEDEDNSYIYPIAAVLGLAAVGGGVLYIKK